MEVFFDNENKMTPAQTEEIQGSPNSSQFETIQESQNPFELKKEEGTEKVTIKKHSCSGGSLIPASLRKGIYRDPLTKSA